MTSRPRSLLPAGALAAAAAALLSGCGKPTPLVSLTAHGTSLHAEAAQYCRADGKCATRAGRPPVLFVTPGSPIGIDVDEAVKDGHGWGIAMIVNGQSQTQVVQNSLYRAVPAPAFGQDGTAQLIVAKLDAQNRAVGQWRFVLADRG